MKIDRDYQLREIAPPSDSEETKSKQAIISTLMQALTLSQEGKMKMQQDGYTDCMSHKFADLNLRLTI